MNRSFFPYFLIFTSLFLLYTSWQQGKQDDAEQARNASVARDADNREKEAARATAAAQRLKAADVPLPPEVERQYFVLGSMAADDRHPLMVTLSNEGASVDRIELTARDSEGGFVYRSLDNRFGYPGYLAFAETPQGLRVQLVPAASPAATAANVDPSRPDGLRVGDILTRVGTVEVRTLTDYYKAMQGYDAGKTVRFTALRNAAPAPGEVQSPATSDEPQSVNKPIDAIRENPPAEALSEAAEASLAQGDGAEAVAQSPAVSPDAMTMEFDLRLIEQPLDVLRNPNRYPAESIDGNLQRQALLTTLASIDTVQISENKRFIEGLEATLSRNWAGKPSDDGRGVEFELPLRPFLVSAGIDADLTLVKSYRLRPFDAQRPLANYDLDFSVTVRNNRDVPATVSVRQEGPTGVTLEGWWYSVKQAQAFFDAAGTRDVVVARETGGHQIYTRGSIQQAALDGDDDPDLLILGGSNSEAARSLRYIGIDSQYFAVAVLPDAGGEGLKRLSRAEAFALGDLEEPGAIHRHKLMALNVGCWFDTEAVQVTADRPLRRDYRIFAGPKDPDVLAAYGMSDTVYYGWAIFAWVAKPLSWILHFFYMIVRNYGIAIMMLTVLVRSIMFPFSWKAAVMGQRMQEMQPEIKRINELYKDDFQKKGVEIQKLYKKYNLNPMASCLPLFIQLPIFIGLYRSLSIDVSLRQKPFLPGIEWANNLAAPDMMSLLPAWMPEFLIGKGTGWLGPYFNLLPIITCGLFLLQQKMLMPKATDDQTRMTQRLMMIMTVVMGILFYKVPAGLCIYFITSSIWSLVERKLVKKFLPAAQPLVAGDAAALTASPSDSYRQPKKPGGGLLQSGKPPEKLSDVFPWLKRFEKDGESNGRADGKAAPAKSGGNGRAPAASRDPREAGKPKQLAAGQRRKKRGR